MERLFENLESVKYPKLPEALPQDFRRGAYSGLSEPPVAIANMLTHVGLLPIDMKLNPDTTQLKHDLTLMITSLNFKLG